MSDRLGGDRRAIFFVIAAAVSAAMIPLTPTDPAKIDAVTKKVTKPAYSFQYVPMVLIGWCLLLAVLSWLDNRVRLRQKLPIQPVVKPAGPPTYNGLAVTSVVVGGLSLAALVTWGGGLWGIASALVQP